MKSFGSCLITKSFYTKLIDKVGRDNIPGGAAAIGFFLLLAIFPAMIAFLSFVAYLPIDDLQIRIMEMVATFLPGEAYKLFEGIVEEVTQEKRGGLLSIGLIGAIWAASSGMYAMMRQLNRTYRIDEERSFIRARAVALLLTFIVSVLVVLTFVVIIMGGVIQTWIADLTGWSDLTLYLLAAFQWLVILVALFIGFFMIYRLGPNVKKSQCRLVSPGGIFSVLALVAASLGFRMYVDNFGDYAATYGSIGAVVILMLWLFVFGFVVLLGSEINVICEDVTYPEESNSSRV